MAESSRIEDLRRRIQKDPASIAFAQLAEELRRAGNFEESVEICRAGLAIHPGYLSARVTLGRALVELNHLDDAQAELEHVLASAPENLAALRGLAEINHRNGDLAAALEHYRAALALAKNDPDLQETVSDLSKKVEPPKPPASADGLTLEQATRELSIHVPPPVVVQPPAIDFFAAPAPAPAAETPEASPAVPAALDSHEPDSSSSTSAVAPADFFAALSPAVQPAVQAEPEPEFTVSAEPEITASEAREIAASAEPEATVSGEPKPSAQDTESPQDASGEAVSAFAQHESLEAASAAPPEPTDPPSTRVIAALEQWLEAIHVTREQRGA
jgi:hypothetical protein